MTLYICIPFGDYSDCEQTFAASSREHTAVTAGETIAITCSITCSVSQTPELTLYKNPSSPDAVGTATSGQPISVTLLKEDNGVDFYCDANDWPLDVRSRQLTFDVQCT